MELLCSNIYRIKSQQGATIVPQPAREHVSGNLRVGEELDVLQFDVGELETAAVSEIGKRSFQERKPYIAVVEIMKAVAPRWQELEAAAVKVGVPLCQELEVAVVESDSVGIATFEAFLSALGYTFGAEKMSRLATYFLF
ncbi:hypothetical protein BDQ17DRAFT_1322645 [Cyathus striatus]|nr:hypothetical protein BDQ17DRAFT_1322645 [Cyathus striatus]